jgi:hypothetical protein
MAGVMRTFGDDDGVHKPRRKYSDRNDRARLGQQVVAGSSWTQLLWLLADIRFNGAGATSLAELFRGHLPAPQRILVLGSPGIA